MIQGISRTLMLLAVSGLTFSGARLQAQQTNTTPNSTPNTTQNGTPNSNTPSNTTPNARQQQQPKPNRPRAAPAGTLPPAIKAGIAAMLQAKANLEKAGDKWGGHRVKAIKLIDQALDACGQTQTPGNGEMKSGPTDETSLMTTATTQLTTAQNDFKNAKNPGGGCRDKALPLITQALQELQLAATAAKVPKKPH
jgi:hypothetical protein